MPRQQRRADERAAAKAKKKVVNAPPSAAAAPPTGGAVRRLKAEDLADRYVRGHALALDLVAGHARRIADDAKNKPNAEAFTYIVATKKRKTVHDVVRYDTNDGGKMVVTYKCDCTDFDKMGRDVCMHVVCEQILRGELVIVGKVSSRRIVSAKARRRPKRRRLAENGKSVEATQSEARIEFADNLPRLLGSLRRAYENEFPADAERKQGGQMTPDIERALTLLYKIAHGKSYEEMQSVYASLIEAGHLRLKRVPCMNTLSDWLNDHALTEVLKRLLKMTAYPFRRREIGAIIDSSKISQMRTAHALGIQYLGDVRDGVHWMRCHALVGVETLICMAVEFSGNRGDASADINFVEPLVEEAIKQFHLQYLLGDKAYFAKAVFNWLWTKGIKAVVPTKKKVHKPTRTLIYDAYTEAVIWFDEFRRAFDEVYRLRPKIEAFFSALKRAAQDFCWSRGRYPEDADPNHPCVAWKNEALCKFLFLNFRTTNSLEHETGVQIDYTIPERCFPPPTVPLLQSTV